MRESSIETLGSREPISLLTLLRDNRFKGILIDKRSYYTVIDKILSRVKRTPEFLKIMQMYHTDPDELEEIREPIIKIIIQTE